MLAVQIGRRTFCLASDAIVLMSLNQLFLGGLLSSRARFRFAGRLPFSTDGENLSTARPLDFRCWARQTIYIRVGQIR
jgi:hypothetical protein